MRHIRLIILTAALLPLGAVAQPPRQAVRDVIRPLPDGCIRLTNFFENDIVNSERHWNKGVLPYKGLVDFFRKGRLSSPWVRCGARPCAAGRCTTATPATRNSGASCKPP